MLYFTDTLYLAPAFVGVLFLVARIWDIIILVIAELVFL